MPQKLENGHLIRENDNLKRDIRGFKSEVKRLTARLEAKEAEEQHQLEHEVVALKRTVEQQQEQMRRMKISSNSDLVRLNRQQEEIMKLKEKEQEANKNVQVRFS